MLPVSMLVKWCYNGGNNTKANFMKKILQFVCAMFFAFLPGFFGIMFTPSGASDMWYNALGKSVVTPEGWFFGVAWAVLYALLGIALFLVISSERAGPGKTKSYALFGVQMILNGLWSYLFFGLHMAGVAFAVIIALIAVAVWMMRAFYPISKTAAYLIVPYILWLIFAAYLNGVVLYLN